MRLNHGAVNLNVIEQLILTDVDMPAGLRLFMSHTHTHTHTHLPHTNIRTGLNYGAVDLNRRRHAGWPPPLYVTHTHTHSLHTHIRTGLNYGAVDLDRRRHAGWPTPLYVGQRSAAGAR